MTNSTYSNIGLIHSPRRFQGQIVAEGYAAAQLPAGRWTVVWARFDRSDRTGGVDKRATRKTWATEGEADFAAMRMAG